MRADQQVELLLSWGAATGIGFAFIEPLLIMLGIGIGLLSPTMMVALQNAAGPVDVGAATGTSAFFRSLGAVIGVALSGSIMTMRLAGAPAASDLMDQVAPKMLLNSGIQQLGQLPPPVAANIVGLYRDAIAATILVGGAITALAFLLVLFLPELPLRTARLRGSELEDRRGRGQRL